MLIPGSASAPHLRRLRRPPRDQRGQALVLGLFFLIVGAGMLYFMFNTGQITREKTALTNAADAAAYSGAALEARALNFLSYTNRAEVANTVAIAQMTALLSWNNYVKQIANSNENANPEPVELCARLCVSTQGPTNLIATYTGNEVARAYGYDVLGYYRDYVAEVVAVSGSGSIAINDAVTIRGLLMPAAAAVWASVPNARNDLIQSVVTENYEHFGDAAAVVALVTDDSWLTHNGGGPATQLYSGEDRQRMGELAERAAAEDSFVAGRNWERESAIPFCFGANGPKQDEFRRGGGTTLNDLEEWEAVDTSSWHEAYLKKGKCKLREHPMGYGTFSAGGDMSIDGDEEDFGDAADNPDAYDASDEDSDIASGTGYSGIPDFFELSQSTLDEESPALSFGVRVTRPQADLRTSNASAQNKLSPNARINFLGERSERDMVAVSAAEIIFDRPRDASGSQDREELASLFNPFWQVRLTEPSPATIMAARAQQ